ncbi:MAG: hypothetical protein ABIL62_05055 [Planctomycetota bacterium]
MPTPLLVDELIRKVGKRKLITIKQIREQLAKDFKADSGDPFAVQRLLGHVDLTMATRYVQDVSEQTDRVIENSRRYVIRGDNVV